MAQIKTERITVDGMTCQNCERRIQKALQRLPGVNSAWVSYSEASATVEYDPQRTQLETITRAVEDLGYTPVIGTGGLRSSHRDVTGAVLLVLAAYLLLRHTGLGGYLGVIPTAEEGMGLGMLFIIGLLSSVHCVAMCGGINLAQCIPAAANASGLEATLRPGLLYNGGRVISYTLVGALVGAVGAVFRLSSFANGLIQLAAGVFMVLMGVNMLGLFPSLRRFVPHLPTGLRLRAQDRSQGKGPLIVGLLNGFMPCGPLQAMQLYALSTGHPLKGALAMLLFSLGTVPLMLGLSVFSASMSRRFTRRVMAAGAVLVVLLGGSMLQNGLALSRVATVPTGVAPASDGPLPSRLDNEVQEIATRLSPYGYEAITVEAGMPVRWTITAENGTITGCNNRLVIPEYGIQAQLVAGENLIEFTPTETGVFLYSCWMGMIRSTITVTEAGNAPEQAAPSSGVALARPQL